MRTTLAIDDDVLMAAKSLAQREQKTIGAVISTLARQALRRQTPLQSVRNGVTLLVAGASGEPVTLELVNQLRDELP
jgi:hypothetical protein